MKFLSVNTRSTLNEYTVAFNVETTLPESLISNIGFNELVVTYENGVMTLRLPEEYGIPISVNTLTKVKGALEHYEASLAAADKTRGLMLEKVVKSTGLPLD